ncbi:hypothetical protein FXO38_12663 [Capsicum annuum]|nr:hypothetical protein FXO38_12663 [Capsicum annuum]KAF3662125.1 hypothetical protein FXO37_12598 [Capsicum annuum]
MDVNKSSGKRPIFGKVFRRNKKNSATTSSLPPKFSETTSSQPNGFNVGAGMELDHETLSRRYDNFEEDLPEEDNIEEQELGKTPTLTSPVTELPKDDDVLFPLPKFSRVKGTERPKRFNPAGPSSSLTYSEEVDKAEQEKIVVVMATLFNLFYKEHGVMMMVQKFYTNLEIEPHEKSSVETCCASIVPKARSLYNMYLVMKQNIASVEPPTSRHRYDDLDDEMGEELGLQCGSSNDFDLYISQDWESNRDANGQQLLA